MRALAGRLRPLMPNVQDVWQDLLTPSHDHHLPKRYEDMLHDFL